MTVVLNRFSSRVPPLERRAAEELRIRFMAALGRSGKSLDTVANELGFTTRALTRWSTGGHLNQAYHKPVEAWIPKQRTDLELARAKKAWARQEGDK